MEVNIPRVIIAGTGSGCGKTTVTCAVLQALKNRHLNCGAFKCGPDFIDPMFHRAICGDSGNLDAFLFSDEIIHYLLSDRDHFCVRSIVLGSEQLDAELVELSQSSRLRLLISEA